MTQLLALLSLVQAHWAAISGVLVALSSVVSSLITVLSNYPQAESTLHTIAGILSFLEHADVGGLKIPLRKTAKPAPVKLSISKGGAVKALLPLLILTAVTQACAAVSWNSPVFYAGPAVAPIEEVSSKHPSPAVAAGYQATIGLGQFDLANHEWDALDLSALALGGVVLPGSGPVGALQIGGEIGTMNGIIGLGILTTPYTADGQGWTQGGRPGTTFAGMLNVQAIVSYFSPGTAAGKEKLTPSSPEVVCNGYLWSESPESGNPG